MSVPTSTSTHLYPTHPSALPRASTTPALKAKPSTTRLTPRHIPFSSLSPPAASSLALLRSKTAPAIPSLSAGPSDSTPNSSLPKRRPSALVKPAPSSFPKPMASNSAMNSSTKTKAGPLTKQHSAFSVGTPQKSSSSSSSSIPSLDKRPRNTIRKNSASNSNTLPLASLRTGSTTSANGSTASITSTSSLKDSGSVLGISLPATSSSSTPLTGNTYALSPKPMSSASSAMPKLSTSDLSPPLTSSGGHSSASSIHYESTGNFSITSTPTSASSHSPGFAPSGFRLGTQSPNRPLVSRTRSGSITKVLSKDEANKKALDSTRGSTTSASSDSTIRASEHNQRKTPLSSGSITDEKKPILSPPQPNPPTPVPTPKYGSSKSSTTSQVKGAIYSLPIWNLGAFSPRVASPPSTTSSPALGSIRSKSSNSIPTRPPREGTPELRSGGLGVSFPVIHRNLAPAPGALARTRSKSTGTVGVSLPHRKVNATPPPISSGISNAASARRPNENFVNDTASQTIGFPYSNSARAATPVIASPKRNRSNSNEGSRDKSPTRSSPGKLTRPGFFSARRTKTSDGDVEKVQKRGPAAGTGHEGYGKYGKIRARGRSTSTVGSATRSGSVSSLSDSNSGSIGGRSGSKDSKHDMDEFFLHRQNPVVIAGGGGVVENQNVGAAGYRIRQGSFSEGGEVDGVPMSRGNSAQSSISSSPHEGRESSTEGRRIKKRSPTPIPTSGLPVKHDPMPNRKPEAFTPPMGAQETFIVTNIYDPASPLMTDPLPAPSSASTSKAAKGRWAFLRPGAKVMPASATATVPVSAQTSAARNRPAHYIMMDTDEQQTAKHAELIFRTLRKNPAKEEAGGAQPASGGASSVKRTRDSVLLPSPPLPLRNMSPAPQSPFLQPNYNNLASSPPQMTAVMATKQQQAPSRKLMPAFVPIPNSSDRIKQEGKERKAPQTAISGMRSPPISSKKEIPKPGQNLSGHKSRPSDGQIQVKALSSQKIQKPVLGLKTTMPKVVANEILTAPAHIGPRGVFEQSLRKEIQARKIASQNATTAEPTLAKPPTPATEILNPIDKGKQQLLREQLPPRGDSIPQQIQPLGENTERESHGTIEKQSPVVILPILQAHAQEHEDADDEEDIWDEYDDIEEFLGSSGLSHLACTPKRSKGKAGWKSNTSSMGSPFHYDDFEAKYRALTDLDDKNRSIRALDSPTLPEPSESSGSSCRTISTCFEISPRSTVCLDELSPVAGSSRIMPPPRIKVEPFNAEIRSVDKVLVPDTPFSVTSFIRFYGSTDRDSRCYSTFEASPPPGTVTESQSDNAGTTRSNKANHSKNSSTSTTASSSAGSTGTILEARGLEDEMKVRLWALMASRWLSFDRVLVSPAHEQLVGMQSLNTSQKSRILIVDGLGTDDWSFYCALTYPSAIVYNLSPSIVSTNISSNGEADSGKPSNHRQIFHSSFNDMFPFPSDFFDVVSFRFLPSSSYPNLPSILSECKRVLAPGGYMETSVLDADLLNMSSRTQRAVDLNKGIMERECEEYETMAGHGPRRAAAVAAACMKPVSERVTRLLEKGFIGVNRCLLSLPVVGSVGDSSKSGSVDLRSPRPSGDHQDLTQQPSAATASTTSNTAALSNNETGTGADDAQINEVVSKVGRWWYTRCYERVITREGEAPGRSMWNDRALVRECAKKGTRFRMLIAYARKALPIQVQLGSPVNVTQRAVGSSDSGNGKNAEQ